MKSDIQFENHGSLFLARPLTNTGVQALDSIASQADEAQFFGNALVIEPRYVCGIIDALRQDFGLKIS